MTMATEYNLHLTKDGDRWDLLAWDHYGDAALFEDIMRENVGVVPANTPCLPGGLTLRIPIKTISNINPDFQPWLI